MATKDPAAADDLAEMELDDLLPYSLDDYYVVSELALEVAVAALQHVKTNSRCHMSRVIATNGLKAVGLTGDLPTDPDGMPEPVKPKGELAEQFAVIEDFYKRPLSADR